MNTPDLTIIILAHEFNEQLLVTIQSAIWAKQVLVITVTNRLEKKLKKEISAFNNVIIRTITQSTLDFSELRNSSLQLSQATWTLFLDSDEVIPQALANEIQAALPHTNVNGFRLKRSDIFHHQVLKHGETGHLSLLRLAKTKSGQWQGRIHEVWNVPGEVATLATPLLHFAHPNIHEFFTDVIQYSQLVAEERAEQEKRFSFWEMVLYPVGKFLDNYFLKLGCLDGFAGLVYAMMMSLHSLAVRVNLYEQTQKG